MYGKPWNRGKKKEKKEMGIEFLKTKIIVFKKCKNFLNPSNKSVKREDVNETMTTFYRWETIHCYKYERMNHRIFEAKTGGSLG